MQQYLAAQIRQHHFTFATYLRQCGGVALTIYNVVRNFKTISQVNNGDNVSAIDIPPSSDLKNMAVVLYLQEKNTNKISAADQVEF